MLIIVSEQFKSVQWSDHSVLRAGAVNNFVTIINGCRHRNTFRVKYKKNDKFDSVSKYDNNNY